MSMPSTSRLRYARSFIPRPGSHRSSNEMSDLHCILVTEKACTYIACGCADGYRRKRTGGLLHRVTGAAPGTQEPQRSQSVNQSRRGAIYGYAEHNTVNERHGHMKYLYHSYKTVGMLLRGMEWYKRVGFATFPC